MSIIKANTHFALEKKFLTDKDISSGAKGLYAYLCSLGENALEIDDLMGNYKSSKDTYIQIFHYLDELIEANLCSSLSDLEEV